MCPAYRPSILDRPAPEPLIRREPPMTEAELAEYLARCRKAFAELDRLDAKSEQYGYGHNKAREQE